MWVCVCAHVSVWGCVRAGKWVMVHAVCKAPGASYWPLGLLSASVSVSLSLPLALTTHTWHTRICIHTQTSPRLPSYIIYQGWRPKGNQRRRRCVPLVCTSPLCCRSDTLFWSLQSGDMTESTQRERNPTGWEILFKSDWEPAYCEDGMYRKQFPSFLVAFFIFTVISAA